MAKKRLGNNPLGHLVSSQPAPKEDVREQPEDGVEQRPGQAAQDEPAPPVAAPDPSPRRPSTKTEEVFKRKTVHMRMGYVRLMKRIAALEDKDIKEVYDEAIGAYLETKQDLIERHDL